MAFWGVEVKTGKPYVHKVKDAIGRLHVSQATLGSNCGTSKSIVQCNVGNRSPVFLCSLFPDKAESCQLNLEFDEACEVIFSVIGPRSVHLTGYYLAGGRHFGSRDDESESYGEDVGESGSEKSVDEDEYDDSFIDDGDPETDQDSPVSDDEVTIKERVNRKRAKSGNGTQRRLRKKYQVSDSDDEDSLQLRNHSKAGDEPQVADSEGKEKVKILSSCKNNKSSKDTSVKKNSSEDKNWSLGVFSNASDASEASDGEREVKVQMLSSSHNAEGKSGIEKVEATSNSKSKSSTETHATNGDAPERKKRKKKVKGQKQNCEVGSGLDEDKCQQNVSAANIDDKKHATDPKTETTPIEQVDSKSSSSKKKKKKEKVREKLVELQKEMEADAKSVGNETGVSDGNPSTGEKKRKKKRRKIQEDEGTREVDALTKEESLKSSRNTPSESRTLSNGLIIEELETGKLDSKAAVVGKKVDKR